jgi:hypothetical protein
MDTLRRIHFREAQAELKTPEPDDLTEVHEEASRWPWLMILAAGLVFAAGAVWFLMPRTPL